MNSSRRGDVGICLVDAYQRRRRLQFTLRGLFATTSALGLALGGWHIMALHGQYIEGAPVEVGQPMLVRGRLIQLLGPRERRYCVYLQREQGWIAHVKDGWTSRCWLCTYPIDVRMGWPVEQGDYTLILRDPDLAPDSFVCGRLVVAQ